MNLIDFVVPARNTKSGQEILTLTAPTKLKIQTTGPGAATSLDVGPASGKTWRVLVTIEVEET